MSNYYTVQKGDTLSKIAKSNNTTVDKIMKLNSDVIKNKNIIHAGQIIRLPGTVTVTNKPVAQPTPPKDYAKLGQAVENCVQKITRLPEFKKVMELM